MTGDWGRSPRCAGSPTGQERASCGSTPRHSPCGDSGVGHRAPRLDGRHCRLLRIAEDLPSHLFGALEGETCVTTRTYSCSALCWSSPARSLIRLVEGACSRSRWLGWASRRRVPAQGWSSGIVGAVRMIIESLRLPAEPTAGRDSARRPDRLSHWPRALDQLDRCGSQLGTQPQDPVDSR